jgi:hypothetical protein
MLYGPMREQLVGALGWSVRERSRAGVRRF